MAGVTKRMYVHGVTHCVLPDSTLDLEVNNGFSGMNDRQINELSTCTQNNLLKMRFVSSSSFCLVNYIFHEFSMRIDVLK